MRYVNLIALVALAAGAAYADSPALPSGAAFAAPADAAESLLNAGKAMLAEAPLSETNKSKLAEAPLSETNKSKAAKPVRARLLIDSALGNANDLVELDAATLKEAEAAGLADSNKAAVAYAATLEQNKPQA